ncbi:MAG: PDGLE domain-containing protein [Nocardioidaceae bacterium]
MTRGSVLLAVGGTALLLAGVLSYFSSSSPDGLQRAAEQHGIALTERAHPLDDGPMAGYRAKGLDDVILSGGVAGVTGVVVVLALTSGLAWAVRRKKPAARGS